MDLSYVRVTRTAAASAVLILGLAVTTAGTSEAATGAVTSRVSISSSRRAGLPVELGRVALGRRPLRRVRRQPRNLVPGDTNGARTFSSGTAWPDDAAGVVGQLAGTRATAPASCRRSPPTAATSPSDRRHEPRARRHERHDGYLRPRPRTGTTARVSVGSGGAARPTAPAQPVDLGDGRYVAFQSARDQPRRPATRTAPSTSSSATCSSTTERVSVDSAASQANGASLYLAVVRQRPVRRVQSDASNLVAGDTNGSRDVFVRDRLTGTTERVSVGPGGARRTAQHNARRSPPTAALSPSTAPPPNLVAGDTNGCQDIFVRDLRPARPTRVSVGARRPSPTGSAQPALSADGRYVAFQSDATNLVAGRHQRFRRRLRPRPAARDDRRVSVGPGGAQADGPAYRALSSDGHFVVFTSGATNLVAYDTNGTQDVFVRD